MGMRRPARMTHIVLLQPFAHHIGHFSAELLGICHGAPELRGVEVTAVTTCGVPESHHADYQKLGVRLVPDTAIPDHKLVPHRSSNLSLIGPALNFVEGNARQMLALRMVRNELDRSPASRVVVLDIGFPATRLYWRVARPEQTTLFYRGGQHFVQHSVWRRDLLPPFTRRTMLDRIAWFEQPCRVMAETEEALEDLVRIPPELRRAEVVVGWTPRLPMRSTTPRDEAARRLGLDPSRRYALLPYTVRQDKGAARLVRIADVLAQRGVSVIFAGTLEPAVATLLKEFEAASVIVDDRFIPEHEMDSYFSLADAIVLLHPYGSGTLAAAVDYEVPVIAQAGGKAGREVREYGLGEALAVHAGDAQLVDAIVAVSTWSRERRHAYAQGRRRFLGERSPRRWLELAAAL